MRLACRLLALAAIVVALTMDSLMTGLAQDATPSATGAEERGGLFLSNLNEGSCGAPRQETAVPLADLRLPETPAPAADDETAASPVAVAGTEVDLPLAELLARGYSVTVQEQATERAVACGAIRGQVDEDGDLFVGLAEIERSGYSSIVWLTEIDEKSRVTLFLTYQAPPATLPTSLLALSAVSLWYEPPDPDAAMDVDDPGFNNQPSDSFLTITMTSVGVPVGNRLFNETFQSLSRTFSGFQMEEIDVPLHGLGARGMSGEHNGFQHDFLFIFDGEYLYSLEILRKDPAAETTPILLDVADRFFDPRRSRAASERVMGLLIYADDDSAYESLLGRMPEASDLPPEFELIEQDVVFIPLTEFPAISLIAASE